MRVIDERTPVSPVPGVRYYPMDVRSAELASVCTGAEVIIHLAALPRVQFSIEHPQDAHAVNVDGTLAVLEAARAAQVRRVVFASSSAVYGDPSMVPTSEDAPIDPKSPYGAQKRMGEIYLALYAACYGLETVSLRFFNVYGSGEDATSSYCTVITRFLAQHAAGQELTMTGDGMQTRDFVHVDDVVRAIQLACTSPNVGKGEVINIGSGRECSVRAIAERIGGPTVMIPPRFEPRRTCADIRRAHALLAWSPTIAWDVGIRALLAPYRTVPVSYVTADPSSRTTRAAR